MYIEEQLLVEEETKERTFGSSHINLALYSSHLLAKHTPGSCRRCSPEIGLEKLKLWN